MLMRKQARACSPGLQLFGGAAGNRNRPIKQLELWKHGIRVRESTRNYVARPVDTPTVLMASTGAAITPFFGYAGRRESGRWPCEARRRWRRGYLPPLHSRCGITLRPDEYRLSGGLASVTRASIRPLGAATSRCSARSRLPTCRCRIQPGLVLAKSPAPRLR